MEDGADGAVPVRPHVDRVRTDVRHMRDAESCQRFLWHKSSRFEVSVAVPACFRRRIRGVETIRPLLEDVRERLATVDSLEAAEAVGASETIDPEIMVLWPA